VHPALVLGFALAVAPYALWQLIGFHHVLTVSATVKAHALNEYSAQQFGGRTTSGYAHFVRSFAGRYVRGLESTINSQGRLSTLGWVGAHAVSICAAVGLIVLITRLPRRPIRLASGVYVLVTLGTLVSIKALVDLVSQPQFSFTWYADGQRVMACVAAALLIWVAIDRLPSAPMMLQVSAVGIVVVLLLPAHPDAAWATRREQLPPASWQAANMEAVAWIAAHGPEAAYGSPDSGAIGYYLIGNDRTVVNLDGLVNNFAYAAALAAHKPAAERYRQEGIDLLVARRQDGSADIPPCAREFWRSTHNVPYFVDGDVTRPVESVPVRVWDLRPCAATGSESRQH